MIRSSFYDIINQHGIEIAIEKTAHFTIGTSPYYSHQNGLAIDIYQTLSLKNYDVLSPVSGEIIKIKEMAAPKPKFVNGIDREYLILISNSNNSKIVFKTLHVKPNVKVGDKIEIGDVLGKTIRNGYFAYCSSPHLHLEIRPDNDAIRARGGKYFELNLKNLKKQEKIVEHNKLSQFPLKIEYIFPEFILAKLPKDLYYFIDPFYGVKGNIDNELCIIDGGIPLYKNGILLFQNDCNYNSNESVFLGPSKIGILRNIRKNLGFFKFNNNIKFFLNQIEVRGLSFFLANYYPLIKIIPYKLNEFSFETKSVQYLEIDLC